MKKLIFLLTLLIGFVSNSQIYKDENDIIKCTEDVEVNSRIEFEGITYIVVDNDVLRSPGFLDSYMRYWEEQYTRTDGKKKIDLCTTKVTDMSYMFIKSQFNGDISNWDVSNVTNMESMFKESEFNGDISKWDVSNVTNMSRMFSDSKFNGDISSWDVSNVTNMSSLFNNYYFNGDISSWDVSNVTNMSGMFNSTPFNGDI